MNDRVAESSERPGEDTTLRTIDGAGVAVGRVVHLALRMLISLSQIDGDVDRGFRLYRVK